MSFVDSFVEFTDSRPCPVIFRKWAAISALSSSMERRVWLSNSAGRVYPNLFVLMVADPGIGKEQAIYSARELLDEVGVVSITPESITKAKLLDILEEKAKTISTPEGKVIEFSSVLLCVEELGTLLSQYDREMISFLTALWNNRKIFEEGRRYATSVSIINPQLSGLCGTQPGFISIIFPEETWEQGFASRLIMVYSGQTPDNWNPWEDVKDKPDLCNKLLDHLRKISNFSGEVEISEGYKQATLEWKRAGMEPAPTHPKLRHYCTRRFLSLLKLSIVACADRGLPKRLEEADFLKAKSWMLEAEEPMPDVFKAMTQKSDKDILLDLHQFVWREFAKTKAPISQENVLRFLAVKLPAERVPVILLLAEKTGMIVKKNGGYIPKPKIME